ncbi:MAG: hypothetical protein LRY55_04085 [Leadbetterella sp.]|nr:hypothetical protein [Leadbetterella sp.]
MDFVRFVKSSRERDSLSSVLILFGFICIGFVLASLIQAGLMMAAVMKDSGGNLDAGALARGMGDLTNSRSDWWLLIIMQGLSSLVLFVLTSLAYWRWIERKTWG